MQECHCPQKEFENEFDLCHCDECDTDNDGCGHTECKTCRRSKHL